MKKTILTCLLAITGGLLLNAAPPGQYRLILDPTQLTPEDATVDWSGIVDSQFDIGSPPAAPPQPAGWSFTAFPHRFPTAVVIDLERSIPLATLWIFDTNGINDVIIQAGKPGAWETIATYDCARFNVWAAVPLNTETRFLRLELRGSGANFAQIALDAYSERGFAAFQEVQMERARVAAEQAELMRQAREEALRRPLIEMEPFGLLSLVDEVDASGDGASHLFEESPAGASRVEVILGRPARVLNPIEDEFTMISYRLGRNKLLRPNGVYVVVVEYPEDKPRSMVIANTGNETIRGFYTGISLGDAFHPKYINNLNESLDVPLSGQWENWTLLTHLHSRFPKIGGIRGEGVRPLNPEDGFTVSIGQWNARNIPLSAGAAVSRLRLFEVVHPEQLRQPLNLPPAELPRRRISWREEMSDGVIESHTPEKRGLDDVIDWWRHKASLMHFLGLDTFTKDLLEFGANQQWDSTEYGGNQWVHQDHIRRHFWRQIVEVMGAEGFAILPYYEYAGSRGHAGLGNQRRARPLTRDDAYSHVRWIENNNADITDPDTYEDFAKILDLTVLRQMDKAEFAGIWIRPRRQLPIGFAPATLARFAEEANHGLAISRAQLIEDSELYDRYIAWWKTKRRDWLGAMRQHLIDGGVESPMVLFTNNSAEAGVSFTGFDRIISTDLKDIWPPILARPEHALPEDRRYRLYTPETIREMGLYRQAVFSPKYNWGGWEWHHSEPANDPETYKGVEGISLSFPINRKYTVNDPDLLEEFTGGAGLALVRHYSLNENMAFDRNDKEKLGYFVADIERAGRFSMLPEIFAMANGNPFFIGYLVGSNYGRGFPGPVREFNANFKALPALPAPRLEAASSDPDVTVRQIATEQHGIWLAIVHTGYHARESITLNLPNGIWREVVSGREHEVSTGTLTLSLQALQLLTLHRP